MEITIKPTKKQDEAWGKLKDKTTKFIGFGGGAGGGKSWLICEDQLIHCYMYPKYRGYIARNELKRLMTSTYVTWMKVCAHHNIPPEDWKLDGKYNVIKFKNGSTIDLLDVAFKPSDPEFERFGSTEYTRGAIEEAGETPFKAFDVLKSRTGRHNLFDKTKNEIVQPPDDYLDQPEKYPHLYEIPAKTLCTFNPSDSWVKRIFYIPWKKKILSDKYAFIEVLYTDNPYSAKTYGEQLSEIKDEKTRRRLKDGDWEFDDNDRKLFIYDNIINMFSNTVEDTNERFLVVDVAGASGKGDNIKFGVFNGWNLSEVFTAKGLNADAIIQKIIEIAQKYQIPFSHIIVDAIGVGEGVAYSNLLQGVIAYKGSQSAFKTDKSLTSEMKFTTDFKNLRSQCMFGLSDMVNSNKVSISIQDEIIKEHIIQELSVYSDVTKEGQKRQVTSKSEDTSGFPSIKSLIGRSPDDSDLLQMRFYFEIRQRTTGQDPVQKKSLRGFFETRIRQRKKNLLINSTK